MRAAVPAVVPAAILVLAGWRGQPDGLAAGLDICPALGQCERGWVISWLALGHGEKMPGRAVCGLRRVGMLGGMMRSLEHPSALVPDARIDDDSG